MLRPARLGAATAAFALILALAPVAVASPRLLGLGVPLAVADTYTTPGHTTLLIAAPGVLANDIDVLGTNLTARLGSRPTHGNLTLATDGGFEYQPDGGFSGTDTFTYQAVEGLLQSLPATVSITVTARPSSTPGPTPTPTPTPAPTPKPTPSPTASPSPTLPLPTSLPLPTVPIPTLQIPALPVATPQESSFPGPSLGPTPAPPAASGVPASASPSSSPAPSGGLAVGAVSVPPGPGSGGPLGGDGGPTSGGLTSGGVDVAPDLLAVGPAAGAISTGSIADLGVGIEWIVPSVLVTLPGLLLIAVALAQLVGGFIWLPLTRRWLRGDGRAVATRGGRAPS